MTPGPGQRRVRGLLALAAAPTFAAMALWSAVAGPSPASMICSPTPGSPLDAMTTMYLLMALFHVPPWLRLTGWAASGSQ
jgi:hypothetical protein